MADKDHGSRLFFVFLVCSALLMGRLFWTYFSAIILAMLLASAFHPLYALTRRLMGNREQWAALAVTLFIVVILIVPVGWFVGTLSKEALEFYRNIGNAMSLKEVQEALQGDSLWAQWARKAGEVTGIPLTPDRIGEAATVLGRKVGLFLYAQITSVASNVLSFVIHFFLMSLTIFYLFRDGSRLKEYLIELIPVPRVQLEKLAGKFHEMAKAIIMGNGLSGIIQGILGGAGFAIFGLNAPFLWGTIMAFMAFLPIVGASAVFLPATGVLLIQGKTGKALGYLIYNACYAGAIEYFVKPRLIGKGMRMNSLLVFIGILGGMTLFGILGIIYGPLIITVFLTLAEIYRMEYRAREG